MNNPFIQHPEEFHSQLQPNLDASLKEKTVKNSKKAQEREYKALKTQFFGEEQSSLFTETLSSFKPSKRDHNLSIKKRPFTQIDNLNTLPPSNSTTNNNLSSIGDCWTMSTPFEKDSKYITAPSQIISTPQRTNYQGIIQSKERMAFDHHNQAFIEQSTDQDEESSSIQPLGSQFELEFDDLLLQEQNRAPLDFASQKTSNPPDTDSSSYLPSPSITQNGDVYYTTALQKKLDFKHIRVSNLQQDQFSPKAKQGSAFHPQIVEQIIKTDKKQIQINYPSQNQNSLFLVNRELDNENKRLKFLLQKSENLCLEKDTTLKTLQAKYEAENQKKMDSLIFLVKQLEESNSKIQNLQHKNLELNGVQTSLRQNIEKLQYQIMNKGNSKSVSRQFDLVKSTFGELTMQQGEMTSGFEAVAKDRLNQGMIQSIIIDGRVGGYNSSRGTMTDLQFKDKEDTIQKEDIIVVDKLKKELQELKKKNKEYKKKNKKLKKEKKVSGETGDLKLQLEEANQIIQGLEKKIYHLIDKYNEFTSEK